VIELLRPQHACNGLAHHVLCVTRKIGRDDAGVEFVGFADAVAKDPLEIIRYNLRCGKYIGEAGANDDLATGGNGQAIYSRSFGSHLRRIYGVPLPIDDVVVDGVFLHRRGSRSGEARVVGFVLGEQQRRAVFENDPALAVLRLVQFDRVGRTRQAPHPRPFHPVPPGPGITEPDGRQQMNLRFFRSAVRNRHADQDVFRRRLGVFGENIEVAVVREDPRIFQFELTLVAAASFVLDDQVLIRKGSLRVLVQIFHVRVGGRAVQVVIALLNVFPVVAFVSGEAEEAFFQDGVAAVPERHREADLLMAVADSGDAVFVPAVGAGPGMIVGNVLPRGPVRAVIFADRSPGPFAQIGPPAFPVSFAGVGGGQPCLFRGQPGRPRVFWMHVESTLSDSTHASVSLMSLHNANVTDQGGGLPKPQEQSYGSIMLHERPKPRSLGRYKRP